MEIEDGVVGLLVVGRDADYALVRFQRFCKLKLNSSFHVAVVVAYYVTAVASRHSRVQAILTYCNWLHC